MTDQNANSKIQPMLANLLSHQRTVKNAEHAPQVQVIIQLRSEAFAEVVRRTVEENGGTVIVFRDVALESRVPGNAIESIAALNSVISIRLARLPTLHV